MTKLCHVKFLDASVSLSLTWIYSDFLRICLKSQQCGYFRNVYLFLKSGGVCNPVAHVLKAIEVFKRFGRGYNPPTGIGGES